jgi:hypothetical protein
MNKEKTRPYGITALSCFFLLGFLFSLIAAVSLVFEGSFLEGIWRLNPRAHERLIHFGLWASILLFVVAAFCAAAAFGLFRGKLWGHRIAVLLISINLFAGLANAVSGTEPRAIVGVPIAGAILIYLLSRRVRLYFANSDKEVHRTQ